MSINEILLEWLADLCAGGAILGCVCLLVDLILVWRLKPSARSADGPCPEVTILKPLHGLEPHLFDRLTALCRHYSGALQLIFGVLDPGDLAVGVATRIRTEFPDASIDIVPGGREHGVNRKVSNLINMTTVARHDILVVSDSDIQIDQQYLSRVISEFDRPAVGAVPCLYGIAGAGLPVPAFVTRRQYPLSARRGHGAEPRSGATLLWRVGSGPARHTRPDRRILGLC